MPATTSDVNLEIRRSLPLMHYFLFALFFVLFASRTLEFDLSLGPGLSVKNAFLYLLFLALAIQTVFTRNRKLEMLSVFGPFFVYVCYAIFTWVVVLLILKYPDYSPRTTLVALKAGPVEHLMVLLLYFYATTDSSRAVWLIHRMIWLIVIGNVITVIDALDIPDLGLIDQRVDGRVGGTIGNSNEYAAFLAYFLPAITAVFLTTKGAAKSLAGAGAALSALAFLMAVSRGAIVGLIVGGVLGAIYLRAFISMQMVVRVGVGVLLLSLVAVAGGFVVGYGDLLLERFALFGGGSFDASSGRNVIWGRALDSMLDHPITLITGFGWYAYESSRNFSYATHNAYLNILYNLGFIGLSLFFLTVGNILRIVRRSLYRADPEAGLFLKALVFGMFALLVSITFGELYTSWLYVWAFAGICLRIAAGESRE